MFVGKIGNYLTPTQRVHHTIGQKGSLSITAGAALMAGLLATVIAGPSKLVGHT